MARRMSSRPVYMGHPGAWREGAGSPRHPLPSLTFDLVWGGSWVTIGLVGLVLLAIGFFGMFGLGVFLGSAFNVWRTRKNYHKTLVKRAEAREKNLDRVEDWIINSELPEPSPELLEREREWERQYTDYCIGQGLLRDVGSSDASVRSEAMLAIARRVRDRDRGRDPNSKRSQKRANRREKREALEALKAMQAARKEFQHDYHCDDPITPCSCSGQGQGYHDSSCDCSACWSRLMP